MYVGRSAGFGYDEVGGVFDLAVFLTFRQDSDCGSICVFQKFSLFGLMISIFLQGFGATVQWNITIGIILLLLRLAIKIGMVYVK